MQKTKGEILDINTRCSFLLLLESVNKRQKQGKFLGIDDVEEATQDASLSGGLLRSELATVSGGGTTNLCDN